MPNVSPLLKEALQEALKYPFLVFRRSATVMATVQMLLGYLTEFGISLSKTDYSTTNYKRL